MLDIYNVFIEIVGWFLIMVFMVSCFGGVFIYAWLEIQYKARRRIERRNRKMRRALRKQKG